MYVACSKIFAILQFLRSWFSLSYVYNNIENKCDLKKFANGSIAKMIDPKNNSVQLLYRIV